MSKAIAIGAAKEKNPEAKKMLELMGGVYGGKVLQPKESSPAATKPDQNMMATPVSETNNPSKNRGATRGRGSTRGGGGSTIIGKYGLVAGK